MWSSVPYPPLERHGVIGDRRTAALVAADGTVDWLCLPDYDDDPVFSSVIDARRGGRWRAGPATSAYGRQRYIPNTAVLRTTWIGEEGTLELTDAMAWPGDSRPAPDRSKRVVLRHLHCAGGHALCAFDLLPRDILVPGLRLEQSGGENGRQLIVRLYGRHEAQSLGFWSSQPLAVGPDAASASARFSLRAGESAWMVLGLDESPSAWSEVRAARAMQDAVDYWRRWLARFEGDGGPSPAMARSLLTTHLLAYAPTGAMVAAPTLGLPERVGGNRNYDYRFAWIRDASLSAASLLLVGDAESAERYLRWLTGLGSRTEAPLQVAYDVHGKMDLSPRRLQRADGYRQSRPVCLGNRAYGQCQPGSLGYLADCFGIAAERGAPWDGSYSSLLRRSAQYVCRTWERADSGIWELERHQHFVTTKVMCWVVLDRAIRLGRELDAFGGADMCRWEQTACAIEREVQAHGYSADSGAFRQTYGRDGLDASTLLIPVMGFLPPRDPRVLSTLDRLEETLGFGGWLHRFKPDETEGEDPLPLGFFEGAFVPCTCWMATARAMARQLDRAEALLERLESAAGDLGLFPEEIDATTGSFRGNYPLLFSHVEHIRARAVLEGARRERSA